MSYNVTTSDYLSIFIPFGGGACLYFIKSYYLDPKIMGYKFNIINLQKTLVQKKSLPLQDSQNEINQIKDMIKDITLWQDITKTEYSLCTNGGSSGVFNGLMVAQKNIDTVEKAYEILMPTFILGGLFVVGLTTCLHKSLHAHNDYSKVADKILHITHAIGSYAAYAGIQYGLTYAIPNTWIHQLNNTEVVNSPEAVNGILAGTYLCIGLISKYYIHRGLASSRTNYLNEVGTKEYLDNIVKDPYHIDKNLFKSLLYYTVTGLSTLMQVAGNSCLLNVFKTTLTPMLISLVSGGVTLIMGNVFHFTGSDCLGCIKSSYFQIAISTIANGGIAAGINHIQNNFANFVSNIKPFTSDNEDSAKRFLSKIVKEDIQKGKEQIKQEQMKQMQMQMQIQQEEQIKQNSQVVEVKIIKEIENNAIDNAINNSSEMLNLENEG